jgi:GNAT superfamily N-acetyltransferase
LGELTFPIEFELRDGSVVQIRPVEPGDRDLIETGIAAMSVESRFHRFLTPLDHLTDEQLRYLTEIDGVHHAALIACAWRDEVIIGGGVARYARTPDEPDCAEAALAVTDDIQGLGLGSRLFALLIRLATENGYRKLAGYLHRDNLPMRAIFDRLGATYHAEDRLLRAELDLATAMKEIAS